MRFRINRSRSTPAHPSPADRASTAAVRTAEPEVVEAPLSAHETDLIRASVTVVEPLATEMTVYFYAILFARHPEVRPMFPPGLDAQRGRLLRALLRIVDLVDDPESLVRFCGHLGRDHRKFGTL
ncbi:flavohemoprotein, partial [Streptomyces fradiae]